MEREIEMTETGESAKLRFPSPQGSLKVGVEWTLDPQRLERRGKRKSRP